MVKLTRWTLKKRIERANNASKERGKLKLIQLMTAIRLHRNLIILIPCTLKWTVSQTRTPVTRHLNHAQNLLWREWRIWSNRRMLKMLKTLRQLTKNHQRDSLPLLSTRLNQRTNKTTRFQRRTRLSCRLRRHSKSQSTPSIKLRRLWKSMISLTLTQM